MSDWKKGPLKGLRSPKGPVWSFLMGVVTALFACSAAFLILFPPSSPKVPQPPQGAKSHEAIQAKTWMDGRLESLWQDLGLRPEDLRSASVNHLEWEGNHWEMEIIEIPLPEGLSARSAVSALNELVHRAGPFVRVNWLKESNEVWVADVWVGGFITHRLIFRQRPRGAMRARLALIVDDMGNVFKPIRPILDLPFPLTLSILPGRPFSTRIARLADEGGKEVMVHIPMEPWGYPQKDPGPGVLLTSMRPPELSRVLREDLSEMEFARGANNHMGSKFTERTEPMEVVAEELAARGLYFVDSLTSPKSVAYEVARGQGVQTYRRDVFLDVRQDEAFIRAQFQKLLKISRLKGRAIAIAHPYEKTIEVLPRLMKEAGRDGFQWVTVSQLGGPYGKPQGR